MSISTQSATQTYKGEFDGITDKNRYSFSFIEFFSPVWTGSGYAAGITIARDGTHPSDRPRCTSAEVVGEHWRFCMGVHGAVLVANTNIKFIWTVAPEISSGESDQDQKSVNLPEALRYMAQGLKDKEFGAHGPDSTSMPEQAEIESESAQSVSPEEVGAPKPQETFEQSELAKALHLTQAQAEQPVKRKRGRPPGSKSKPKV